MPDDSTPSNEARALLDTLKSPKRISRNHKTHTRKDRRGNKTGRPWYSNLLNDEERRDEIIERFCAAVELGLPFYQAAPFAGIHVNTASKWINDGRRLREEATRRAEAIGKRDGHMPKIPEPDDSPQHATWRFLERVEEAESMCATRCWYSIMSAVDKGDWRAAKSVLEAKERGGFTVAAVKNQGEPDLKIATDYKGMSIESIEATLKGEASELTVIDVKPSE